MISMNRARVGLALLLFVTSCFAERRGLSRDGLLKDLETTPVVLPLPTLDELVALRAPEPPPRPASIDAASPSAPVDLARVAAAKGDIAAAEKAWTSASADLLADRCLVEGVLRRYEPMLDACSRFLKASPEDPRAAAVVRILVKASPGLRAAGDAVAHDGPSWVKACAARGGECSDLAYVVAEEAADSARAEIERARFADAVAASGRLVRAHVEGPFEGDLRALWARDAAQKPLALAAPAGRAFDVVDEDGCFEPSRRGVDGLYRLRLAGTGGGPAVVYVTGAHATRVRIDGVVVADRSPDVSSPAVTRVPVELAKGAHVVEVLAWSSGEGDRIGVSILGKDGRPALREGAAARGAGVQVASSTTAAEADLMSAAPDDVNGLFRVLWRQVLARSPSLGADPDEVRQISRALVARFGWSPLALAVAAEAMGDDRSVPDRVASSTASRLWARVRETWPDHPVARISQARDLREERPDEALDAYRALVTAQPKYPFGRRELIDLALDADLVDEAFASASALLELERSPENIDAAEPALKAAGDVVRAARLDVERARLDENLASTRVARHLLDEGRTDDGLRALGDAAAREKGSRAHDEEIALLALRDPKAALAKVSALLEDFPGDGALVAKKAELLAALEGKDKARAFLVEKLPLVRDSDRAGELAEELGVTPPWAARLQLGDDVIAARRTATSEPFPGHGAVALLDDVERVLYEDSSSLLVRHLIIELRSKDVIDRFGEISLGDGVTVRLRVVKPDGSVIEPERHKGVDDVSLPQLAPGDIVELLTADREGPSRVGGNFETRALDGAPTPALSRRYIVSFPEGWDEKHALVVVATNGLPQPRRTVETDGEGRRRVRLEQTLENVDATPREPFVPEASETAKNAGFAWNVDEALWARLRGPGLLQAAARDAWLDACAARIAGDGDDEEKLRRIFAFVVRRIEPDTSPDAAAAVLATGQGARTALFVALLRGVGIDAAPVSLQLVTQPAPSTYDAKSWSIIAVRARAGGKDHYAIVDGNAVLDRLPPLFAGAGVLELTPATISGLTRPDVGTLPDSAIDDGGVRVQAELRVEDGNVMRGLVVVTIPAAKADGARRGVRRATPDQLQQILERSLADSLPGLRVVEVKTPDVELAGAPLRLGARVEVPLPEAVDGDDGPHRFEHLFAQGASGGLQLIAPLASYLGVADRRQPMLVGADKEVLEVQIALPASGAFVEAPEPLTLQAGPFALDQSVEITNGTLLWRREIRTANARVPVRDWPTVRAGLAALAARTDARLSFVLAKAGGKAR
jgi:hypothetical protein